MDEIQAPAEFWRTTGSEPDPEKVEHSGKVIADRILIQAFMSLILQSDGIVASHTQVSRALTLPEIWKPAPCVATSVMVITLL